MREVDVEERVTTPFLRVTRFGRSRGVPEIRGVRFSDAGAGADDGDFAEVGGGGVEHGLEGGPGGDVCAVEESAWRT